MTLLSLEQVSLADLYRRRLESPCFAHSIDRQRQAERAFIDMG